MSERKREFVQLAKKLGVNGTSAHGKFMSEKLDGQRCFWDGGITRGLPVTQIPWANILKDARYITAPVSTGLWTRYGKTIQAHSDWLDDLPACPLDGELWLGRGRFQEMVSIASRIDPIEAEWARVGYHVWDSPNLERWLLPGRIYNAHWDKLITPDMATWAQERAGETSGFFQPEFDAYYEMVYYRLRKKLEEHPFVTVIEQEMLSRQTEAATARLEEKLAEVLDLGGEGLMIHHHSCRYWPTRCDDLLKYKPYSDEEATVVGYTWGAETDKGSKLLGLMGAAIVEWNGVKFKLSGFTEAERIMSLSVDAGTTASLDAARSHGARHAGEVVQPGIENPTFPLGSEITFLFRGLTDEGIPKEARFFRKGMQG